MRKPPIFNIMLWLVLFAQTQTLTPLPLPAPRPEPQAAVVTDVREVEIGAWRYRVRRLSDDEVEVVGGDAAAPRTGNVLQRFQLAAERATGCKMRKPGWGDVGVRGTLDCTARRIP